MSPRSLTAKAGSPPVSGRALLQIAADGGHDTGFGHLGRCLALAEALDDRAAFDVGADAARFVESRGGRVECWPDAPVVLLDRRQPTEADEVRALKASGRRVVLLDDMGSGRLVADLVIDPPTAAAWPATPVPRLAGFDHVLLRRDVLRRRRAARPAGVLLAMGGSDPAGATAPLAEALGDAGIEVTANLGPAYKAQRPTSGRVLEAPDQFIDALAHTALLVVAYGHTLLEAAHLGVPAIAVVLQAEQREHAEAFASNDTAVILDMSSEFDPQTLVALTTELLGSDAWRAKLARTGPGLVDGRGAKRVADAIRALA